jgi:RimJ/RimL family protein N-acetyltransferase/GNAT superfamily N-acetyltransferase
MDLPIETERLWLRAYEDKDLADILEYSSGADFWLARNLDWSVSEEGVREYWEAQREVDPRTDPKWLSLVVELKAEGKVIGHVGIGVVKTGGDRQGMIGWLLGQKYQGQGFATEAARALVANGLLVVAVLLIPLVPGAIRLVRQRLRARPTPATPAIRPATVEDLPGLSSLGEDQDWLALVEDPAAAVSCLSGGADLVGVAAGRLEGKVGRISVLYVTPRWRRRYWGSRLAQAFEAALREQGAEAIEVTVPSREWPLARFWDGLGWKPTRVTYAYAPRPARWGKGR